jgi:homoserine kinase type II
MSGASVFQCQLASGDVLALKCWPEQTGLARIKQVHQVMQRSKNNGCELVPTIQIVAPGTKNRSQTVFSHQQNHWDLTQWMPGEPAAGVASAQVTLDQVRSGAALIARFHASVRGLAVQHQPPPAVLARLKRLGELERLVPQALDLAAQLTSQQLSPELQGAVHDACRLVQWNWNDVSSRIARSLSQYADQKVPIQYVLRDIHREHILFTDHKPTGLIDFDAVRMDTSATDLARWVGSFSVQTGRSSDREIENLWDAAVAGFHDQNSLKNGIQTEELNVPMARDLCFATTWISLANWLVWLLCQQRAFPPGPRVVASRIRKLTASATQGV